MIARWPLAALAGAALLLASAAIAVPAGLPVTAPAPPIDPIVITPPRGATADAARLAIASEIAAILMPAGAFQQSVQPSIDRMTGGARNGMLNAPMRAFVRDAAIKPETPIRIDEATAARAMAVIDPAFAQRQAVITDLMAKRVGAIIQAFEPQARTALAKAYAGRMGTDDLTALLAFLHTPAGAAFAQAQSSVGRDPAITESGGRLLVQMNGVAPDVMKDAVAATGKLPRPRRFADLTEGEKAQVFRLIGATPASPKTQ